MGKRLINIDNGGTLTDVCVVDDGKITYTKTLTTPYDLSRCLFDGLTKASQLIYGEPQLAALLQSTDYIRYSTTQGTNALIQRQGPKLGLLTNSPELAAQMLTESGNAPLFDALVGERMVTIDVDIDDESLSQELLTEVNKLVSNGTNRLVVAFDGPAAALSERRVQRLMLSLYPRHLLGSIPLSFSAEMFGADPNEARRAWSTVLNAFLHPAMERFLFNAESRLRAHRTRGPLLIFRNDGGSSRVAKSSAIKTYSSGPRGGLEGTKALAGHYGFDHVLMVDVGGTTTDVGMVRNGQVRIDRYGSVDGVRISLPLAEITSSGVGGSSIIEVVGSSITVGPRSVGSAPGPACFAMGGSDATITDVLLLTGVLDSSTFLGGTMSLDATRSEAVIAAKVAEPLGIGLAEALAQMENAFTSRLASVISAAGEQNGDTVIAAFGGAGPMTICDVARKAGVRRVLVPDSAAVFSAYGIGFSDITQHYQISLDASQPDFDLVTEAAVAELGERARRDISAEGIEVDDCTLTYRLVRGDGSVVELNDPSELALKLNASSAVLELSVVSELPHISLASSSEDHRFVAVPSGQRSVLDTANVANGRALLAVFDLESLSPGAAGVGPAIIEGPFFTMKIPVDWEFLTTTSGDVLLSDQRSL
jgi:N-methylhydantoinase A/oxoprolinase/acetone carboxylase beta subunit